MPDVSVVIPTYNRRAYLEETLRALARQTAPCDKFEVIVVDDGSQDDTRGIAETPYPFTLRYLYQANAGDAAARNTGAKHSGAELLVFLDDDVLPAPGYIAALAAAHQGGERRIVNGIQHLWLEKRDPPFDAYRQPEPDLLIELPFAELCSNNMSLRRVDYERLGMMQGLPFGGSSMWCDTDFAYRAYQGGFRFWQSTRAVCWHRDYTMADLNSQIRRAHESSYRAVALLQRHPGLLAYLPMFADMTPIRWGKEPPALLLRKSLRPLTSSRPVLWLLQRVLSSLDRQGPAGVRESLERWAIGGYVYRGFRLGLREFGGLAEQRGRTGVPEMPADTERPRNA